MSKADATLKPFLFPAALVAAMAILHVLGLLGLLGPIGLWANSPRDWSHPWGVVLFHLRHDSWGHWFANSVPLVALSGLARLMVPRAALRTWPWLVVASGMLLWVWGRSGGHIGASALTYGWFHFLLGMGLWRRDRAAIAGMLAAILLFGSMFWVFVAPAGVSWEGHTSGALAGHLAAWHWRKLDPMPKPLFTDDDVEDVNEETGEPVDLYATRRPPDNW